MRCYRLAHVLLLLGATFASAADRPVLVHDDASLRAALKDARPGAHIRIAPGRYRPRVWVENLQGTANAPIIIEGADEKTPPLFEGGVEGLHFARCSHLTLRNIAVQKPADNGINIDDGGAFETPAHHILLEKIHVTDVGPQGNHDAIKLSGVDDFVLRGCTVEGWGGQSVDMVGCHRGVIDGCTFRGKPGFSQDTGPQTKGGSREITIRRCLFENGGVRAVNLGGSTDLRVFRPQGMLYEAKDITVEGCTFIGSEAPIAYVGVDGATVRYNTIYRPAKWVMRILQETTAKGFAPCRNGRFEHNLVVFRRADLQTVVNVGPNTQPETFKFAENFWYCEDRPEASKPVLPAPETGGLYGIDPRLQAPTRKWLLPTSPQAAKFGATAWRADIPSAKKPRFTAAPGVDLSKRIIWGSECETPDGRGLRFGGCDQQADDGAVHTQIKVDGQWKSILDDLRKANPLQERHDQVRDAGDTLKRMLTCYRGVYFQGLPPDQQGRAAAHRAKLIDASGDVKSFPGQKELLEAAGIKGPIDADGKARLDRFEQFRTNAKLAVLHLPDHGTAAITPALMRAVFEEVVALQQAAEILDAEPAPRALSPIVYDAKSKLFVIFGGDHLDYMTNDTWIFDPAKKRWEQRHPKSAPPPRANHTLTAAGDGKVELSGGFTHNNIDIWYMGPLYQLCDDGDWTYDVAADTWSSKAGIEGVEPDQRAYRSGVFMPDYFLKGDKPDAAANEAKLKALPVNTWVAMNPPLKPRVNRDWGSACIAPDFDVLLRWSGGHCAHGGSDVPMYHFATNRWELPFPIEFPLGQCYSNTSYPTGFNFNRRPWVSGHTYKNFGYDPTSKLMVFTGHNPWSYLFDPQVGDWTGRSKKPRLMCYDGSFYTLTLCSTGKDLYCWGGQYGQAVGMHKWRPESKSWETLTLTGVTLPGPECDHSGLAFDSRRNRLILFPKKYAGRLYALDCGTNELTELKPGGANAAAATVGFWRELAYVPDADTVLLVGCSLAPTAGTKDAIRPSLAYDCNKNEWIVLNLGGTHPAGKAGRDVSQGSAYDAKRRLIWATDTNGEVYVLRLDMKAAHTPRSQVLSPGLLPLTRHRERRPAGNAEGFPFQQQPNNLPVSLQFQVRG